MVRNPRVYIETTAYFRKKSKNFIKTAELNNFDF